MMLKKLFPRIRFGHQVRTVVLDAQSWTRILGHRNTGSYHLLLAIARYGNPVTTEALREHGIDDAQLISLAQQEAGLAFGQLSAADAQALRSLGIDISNVADAAQHTCEANLTRPYGATRKSWVPRFGRDAKAALEQSLNEARELGSSSIDPAHLLLALLDRGQIESRRLLERAGGAPDEIRLRLLQRLRMAA